VALANDVGVLTEQVASDRSALGNLPQAFSHLALINAVGALLH
jgi:GH15 family glucan-1,4-alpha-glucosidase